MDKRIVWAKVWSMKRVAVAAPKQAAKDRVGQCYCCGHYIYDSDDYVAQDDKMMWCQRCADDGAAW